MPIVRHDVSRAAPDLHRLDRMVTPRWLREHRRARARAARPDAVAADIADEVVARTLPSREMTFTELMRAQGVKPFGSDELRSDAAGPTAEEWAAFRAALAEGRRR
jgi:hypothetical protein